MGGESNKTFTNDGNNWTNPDSSLSNRDYTVNFYCNDTAGNRNYTETVDFSRNFPIESGTTTGGGSGSSRSATFESDVDDYESTLSLGDSEFGSIELTNTAAIPVEFNISTNSELIVFVDASKTSNISSDLSDGSTLIPLGEFNFGETGYVDLAEDNGFSKTSMVLASGEKRDLEFTINAPKETGVYTGKIIIETLNTRKEILVSVNVKTEDSLFDLTIEIPSELKILKVGENIVAQIGMIQAGVKQKLDVTLEYVVKDFDGIIYYEESETIAVFDQKSIQKEFNVGALSPGSYLLGVELFYPNGVAVASSQFRIEEDIKLLGREQFILVGIVALVIISLLVVIIKYKRRKVYHPIR